MSPKSPTRNDNLVGTTRGPWSSGPGEILAHGLSLLKEDTDTNRRLALLSIDNAVELMLKTFLGLPRRITGLKLGRTEYEEIAESFPKLLDAAEQYATDKPRGIDLGEIEWYHRLRNQLYHQGNGLTVERTKVEVYAGLAKLLYNNLFGCEVAERTGPGYDTLGEYLATWAEMEQALVRQESELSSTVGSAASRAHRYTPASLVHKLAQKGVVSSKDAAALERLRLLRNQVIHGEVDHKEAISATDLATLKRIRDNIRNDVEKLTRD
jgi:hypothetical protein